MKKFFLSFFLILSLHHLVGQTLHFTDSLKLSYEYISSLKISEGQKILTDYESKDPKNVWIDYEKNFSDFLEVFISEDKNLFNQKQDFIAQRYNRISNLPEDNPYRLWMMANMNLQWAFVRVKFGQYLQTGSSIIKAYRLISQNEVLFPDFVPNGLTLGVLHIMIGLIPDQYRWVLKLVSMEGTVEQGKKEIYSVLEHSLNDPRYSFLRDESLFYMGFIDLTLTPDHQTLSVLKKKLEQVSDTNLLMDFLKADILVRTGQNDAALAMLNKTTRMKGYFPFYYLNYMKGDCLLKKLDYQADSEYRYFLHHFKGENYVKDAWRKRAWIALLQGDTLGYHRLMDSVLVRGGDMIDADKQAYREAQSGKIPNVSLLKSRVLFDGGYYGQSKKVLNAMNGAKISPDQHLQRTYRYGRIAQHQHNWPEAKKEYRRTIEEGRNSPLYFAGNSALKLGEIYEIQDSLSQAEYYYRLCLQLNFKGYRNSIKGKAKESLTRVQQRLKNQ
ncbi:MAG: tetratricopeptide repeat protein [Bacteroidales bacterium]|nr:tetratricopeptide repeat protein [Bacteroidales bacterium]